jgi:hypothetical protein
VEKAVMVRFYGEWAKGGTCNDASRVSACVLFSTQLQQRVNYNRTVALSLRSISSYERVEVFTAVTMKNGVFWDVALCVVLVRTDVSEERSASIIRVTRISELGTTLAVTSNRRTLRRNTMYRLILLCDGM